MIFADGKPAPKKQGNAFLNLKTGRQKSFYLLRRGVDKYCFRLFKSVHCAQCTVHSAQCTVFSRPETMNLDQKKGAQGVKRNGKYEVFCLILFVLQCSQLFFNYAGGV